MSSILCKYNVQGLHFVQKSHHFVHYSTSSKAVSHSFSDYLVHHLGFSHHQSLSISAKLQPHKVIDFNSCDKANSVVDFLKQHDFDDTHLRKIVSLRPTILFSNVNKTLKPKFKLLQDLGISGSILVTVISSHPTFVTNHMNHIISNLRTILGGDENLFKFLKRSAYFTTSAGLENLISNVALLENDYGFDNEAIRNCILHHPATFLSNPEFFQNIVTRVEEELGIPRNSRMFLYGINFLTSYGKKKIESKCQVFKNFGWSDGQISDLIRRNPCSLTSSEENMRKKLDFLVNKLGYKPDFLASHSALFSYSLEKRLVPRHRVLHILKEKGLLDYNFYTAALKTETNFLKIVKPYLDDVPGLLEIYNHSKGCPNTDSLST